MADLRVEYMGLKLANPLVVGACSLSSNVDMIRKIEELGAGALVIKSLFEEQIRHEIGELEDMLSLGDVSAEAITFFPDLPPAGARTHLMWVKRTREAVGLPLIGSINATANPVWVDYARRMEDCGVDGLELNFYAVETDLEKSAAEIEAALFRTVESVRSKIGLPLSIKLGPWFTSVANIAHRLDRMGVNAVVLFNRFLQPDIDPREEKLVNRMVFSTREEMRLPLRWIALLSGRVGLDLIGSTGVREPEDVVKYLLAGAQAVQVVGVLLQKKPSVLKDLLKGLSEWMDAAGYASVQDFRGKLSQNRQPAPPKVFERAQYFDFLLRANSERVVVTD